MIHTMIPSTSPHSDSAYEAYFVDLEARADRAKERRNAQPPMVTGTPMTEDGQSGYFCTSCWKRGDETGFHNHETPPCDSIRRR